MQETIMTVNTDMIAAKTMALNLREILVMASWVLVSYAILATYLLAS